jgi:hypothetical protein
MIRVELPGKLEMAEEKMEATLKRPRFVGFQLFGTLKLHGEQEMLKYNMTS